MPRPRRIQPTDILRPRSVDPEDGIGFLEGQKAVAWPGVHPWPLEPMIEGNGTIPRLLSPLSSSRIPTDTRFCESSCLVYPDLLPTPLHDRSM